MIRTLKHREPHIPIRFGGFVPGLATAEEAVTLVDKACSVELSNILELSDYGMSIGSSLLNDLVQPFRCSDSW